MSDYIRPVFAVVLPSIGGFVGSRLTQGSMRSKPDGPPSWYEVSVLGDRCEGFALLCCWRLYSSSFFLLFLFVSNLYTLTNLVHVIVCQYIVWHINYLFLKIKNISDIQNAGSSEFCSWLQN